MSRNRFFCPNCGSVTASDDRFCPDCGKALVDDTQPPHIPQKTKNQYTSTKEPYVQAKHVSATSETQKPDYSRYKARFLDRCIALLLDGIINSILVPLWLLKDMVPEKGKSFGKSFLKLKVVNYDTGLPISAGQAFVRNIVLYLFCWIDIFIPLFTNDGRRIGDYIAKTIVIEDR